MFGPKVHSAMIAMTVLVLPVSEARASWWKSWFGCCQPQTACYQPQPCCQTVNYVPQTCFRTVYVNTPVTTYRPVSACDPCTGCPTTVMRPVTQCVAQAQLVPYTTYRPVVSPCATGCGVPVTAGYASPCATGGCATAGCATGGCATGGCATGGCGTAVTASYPAPVTPVYGASAPPPTTLSYAPAPPQRVLTPVQPGMPGATVQSFAQPPGQPTPAPAPNGGNGNIPPQNWTPAPNQSQYPNPNQSQYPNPNQSQYPNPNQPQQPNTNPAQPQRPNPNQSLYPNPNQQYPGTTPQNGQQQPQQAPPNQNNTQPDPANDNAAPYDAEKPADNREPQSRILLPRSSSTNLHGLDPESQDRTTAIPLRQAQNIKPASMIKPITIRKVESSAWRAGQ